MVAVGVQMKPVVMPPPDRADLSGLLQHDDAKPGRAHRHGTSEPRRARTDDDGVKGRMSWGTRHSGRCEGSNLMRNCASGISRFRVWCERTIPE